MLPLLDQPPALWATFFLVLCRLGTVVAIAPVFGQRGTPAPVKVAVALTLSLTFLPLAAAGAPALPADVPTFLLLVAREVLVGGVIGLAVLLLFVSLQAAGQIVGVQIGFSLGNVINPLLGEQLGLVDQFYALLATLVLFAMDGHHSVLGAVERSFALVPLATVGGPAGGDTLPNGPALLLWGGELFVVAARIALPVVGALLLTDVALALIARSLPQLNVFALGAPAKAAVGLAALVAAVPVTVVVMADAIGRLGATAARLLGGG